MDRYYQCRAIVDSNQYCKVAAIRVSCYYTARAEGRALTKKDSYSSVRACKL